jgi:hypothetical protein
MSVQNDGGAAFPQCNVEVIDGRITLAEVTGGMSLRDYFAAAALGHIPKLLEVNGKNLTAAMIAEWSYEVADAMLIERERTPNAKPHRPA